MRRLWIAGIALLILSLSGISARADQNPYQVTVQVESAFTHVLPSFDADEAASVFKKDKLQVVSRNLDGTWFEVRRPGRLNNLGWINNKLVDWDFQPELLPLGDLTTGVIGPKPLTSAPAFATFVLQEVTLRDRPLTKANKVFIVPALTTVPVLERNQDGSWLHVNYLGYDGWIIAFATRPLLNTMDIPQGRGLPPLETITVVVIPVEVQQAQIDRLRAYIVEHRTLAGNLESFWWSVFRGEVMPCNPPPEIQPYLASPQDVRELPELGRYVPRLDVAVTYLNQALAPLHNCGVVSPKNVGDARDSSINARVIYDAALDSLKILETEVVHRKKP